MTRTGGAASTSRSTGSPARNDVGATMWDVVTNGGYDGLNPTGPNLNQGAESTLALISTMQYAPRPVGSGTNLGQRPEVVNRLSSSSTGIVATLAPTSA